MHFRVGLHRKGQAVRRWLPPRPAAAALPARLCVQIFNGSAGAVVNSITVDVSCFVSNCPFALDV